MDARTKDIFVFLLIGVAAGWLASLILGGGGLLRYLLIGVIGSFVGGYLLNVLGVNLGIKNVLASRIITATIGAMVVVLIARVIA